MSTFFNKDKCALSLFSVHFCLINTSARCLFNCSLLFNKHKCTCVYLYQCPYVSFSGHFCLISRSAYVCFSVHMCFSVVAFGLISSVRVQWSLLFNKNKCAYNVYMSVQCPLLFNKLKCPFVCSMSVFL